LRCSVESDCQHRGGLSFAKIVTHGLSGSRAVTESAEDVIAQLKSFTQWFAVSRKRYLKFIEAPCESCANVQRTLNGVLAGLVANDSPCCSEIDLASCGAEHIEELTDVQFDLQFIPNLECGSWCIRHQAVGVHLGEIANQDGNALAKAPGLTVPLV
jgi:hypothetical protein